ncbi:MAG: GC-type dockerin domain-anchored protein [Phycisphaerales bacterium]
MRAALPLALAGLAIPAAAHAQLLSGWSAPAFDDGRPIPDFVDSWLTDVSTGAFEDVTTRTGAQALAADNTRGLVYASTGRSLSTYTVDGGELVQVGASRRIFDASGTGAEPDQITSMGFARGVIYAFADRKLGDEQRGRGIERGFYTIDPSTAVATFVAPSLDGQAFPGIDYNPVDGLMYAITGTSPQTIVSFDLDAFVVTPVAVVPDSIYDGIAFRFDGVAVGDCKVYLTNGLNSRYGDAPIAVFNLETAEFEPSLPSPPRTAENRAYASGATFVPRLGFPAAPGSGCGESCPADLDGDGVLTVFDFLEFQNLFSTGDLAADFDGDGARSLFDFLAFQNEFDAGC